jgi:hypothetical protein
MKIDMICCFIYNFAIESFCDSWLGYDQKVALEWILFILLMELSWYKLLKIEGKKKLDL